MRRERARIAVKLRAEGKTADQIAALLGCSRSYAAQLYGDPDGIQDFQRKRRYAGTCERCGGPTSGANGRALAAKICGECAHILGHEGRYWTRERVIEAIQRFAAEHGRPPTANDWNHGGRGEGYPPVGSCYGRKTTPFIYWADAIEAAGFPRPVSGHYKRTPEIIAKQIASRGQPRWSKPVVIKALRDWYEEHGHAPTQAEWARAAADHPCHTTVTDLFGGWNLAIEEASLPSRPQGTRQDWITRRQARA